VEVTPRKLLLSSGSLARSLVRARSLARPTAEIYLKDFIKVPKKLNRQSEIHRYVSLYPVSHRSSRHITNGKARDAHPANYRAAPQLIHATFHPAFL